MIKVGDWVKADIIGLGFYEVESISEYHINFKCLKKFGSMKDRGHVTNIHHGLSKKTGERIKIKHEIWFKLKIK